MIQLFLPKEERKLLQKRRKIKNLEQQRQALMQERADVNAELAKVTTTLDALRGEHD